MDDASTDGEAGGGPEEGAAVSPVTLGRRAGPLRGAGAPTTCCLTPRFNLKARSREKASEGEEGGVRGQIDPIPGA